MKGVPGLLIAVGLGIVGAFCNWLYLAQKGLEIEQVHFIIVDDGTKINAGDRFTKAHFRRISIPKNAVGDLEKGAPLWSELETVVGMAATKSYGPGEIILRQHLRTPPETDIKKLLAPDERVLWIPVDTRTFVPSLVNAGDQVSFVVSRMNHGAPPLVSAPGGGEDTRPNASKAATEIIGPFRILALGNRLGSSEVLKAYGGTAAQENIMAIAVKITAGVLDERGQQISDLLRLTNFQQVQVLLHPSGDVAKALK
ncbi:MAG: hypothetical protein EXS05_18760 [Planctomycetaceae bacterium]|nr:hypothetical protein [Planctomycetaceae bacterium]